jgi:PAS domain S-box-containing protein
LEVVQRVFDTGKPVTTNLYKGARTGLYAVGVHVPVFRGKRVVYDLLFGVRAEDFQKVLSQQRIPPEWYATILDANKVIVARSRFPERYVGRQIFPAGVKQIDEHLEGTVEAPGQERVGVFATFSRSPTTGWTVVVGVPRALMRAAIRRWLMWAVGGIILLSTVTLALALFLARRITGSIQALVAPALALGSGEPVEIGELDLIEANNVAQSLVKASQLLQEHTTERERVEEALRLSEEKFAKAFVKNQAAIGLTRLRDGVFLEVNDTWVELVGYSREEMIGHSSRTMMWPTRDACARCLRKLREKGSLRGWEQEFLKKSGEVFVTELSAQIWILNGKRLVVTTLVDITARKRAEEALQESESRFRAFFETAAVGTAEVDLQGRFVQVNRRFCQITGYSREELLGKTTVELTHPEDRDADRLYLQGRATMFDTEKRYVRKDGIMVWVHVTAVKIRDAEGNLLRSAGVIEDITERKRAEEALRESESRLRAFFETAAVGTSEVDVSGRFVRVNQRFCQITGYSQEELLGMTPADLTHPEDRDRDREKLTLFLQGRLPIYDVEKRYVRKDGRVIWVHVTSAMVRDAEGRLLRSAGIIQDITERKRAEAALIQSEKLASVGRMSSAIAHEINNPLETIGHAIYLAATDSGTPPQVKSYLGLATQELERITQITTQTLAFHRENRTPSLIDLRESVDGVLRLFAPRLKARGISVETRYVEVDRVTASRGEVQQVISNLLSNSMDAVPNNGKIHLRLARSLDKHGSAGVRFTIADTGTGIPRERLKNIFEPFFTTKEVVGTGLGLWVTKQIIDSHGATIRVRSKPGRGTVFSIVFPTQGLAVRPQSA